MNLLAIDLGKIEKPPGLVPDTGGDPSNFVASFIRNGITILIISAFVIGLIWMIFAGYSFIFAGDDPKKMSSAWTRIYMGLLGLVVVVGAYALIRLVEVVFGVEFLSAPFQLIP